MIKVFAIGNIGKDAETKKISDENSVTSFSIASSKKIKDEVVTTWINCKKWNAGKLADYLLKGTKIAVTGELEIREHEGKYYTSIIVHELEFCGSRQDKSEPEHSLPESDLGGKYSETDELPNNESDNLPF